MGPKRPGSSRDGYRIQKGAKEINLGSREQKILGIVSKNLTDSQDFSSPRFARLIS